MSSWSLFVRYLFSRRSESIIRTLAWLVMSATFIGVTCLVVVICIMNGFNVSMGDQLLATTPHIEIRGKPTELTRQIKEASVDAVSTLEFTQQDVVVRTADGKFSGAVARGIGAEAINDVLLRLKLTGQNSYYEEYVDLKPGEVVLSEALARNLKIYQGEELIVVPPEALLLPPGEAPPIDRVRVKSFFSADVGELGTGTFFYDPSHTLKKFKKSRSQIQGIELRLKSPNDASDFKNMLIKKLKFNEADVSTWGEKNATTFFALKMEKITMAFLLSLAVLVTSFGLIMVLVMLVVEKRKDIGLFLALGQSLRETQMKFAGVGFWLASFGLFGGLMFGLLVAYILKVVPLPKFPEIYSIRDLPIEFDIFQIFIAIFALGTLAFLSSWLPVRRAINMSPSEALRGVKNFDK